MNNAAIVFFELLANCDLDHNRDMMQVNVHGVVQLTKLAVPHLEKTKGHYVKQSINCRPTAYFISPFAPSALRDVPYES